MGGRGKAGGKSAGASAGAESFYGTMTPRAKMQALSGGALTRAMQAEQERAGMLSDDALARLAPSAETYSERVDGVLLRQYGRRLVDRAFGRGKKS